MTNYKFLAAWHIVSLSFSTVAVPDSVNRFGFEYPYYQHIAHGEHNISSET